MEVNLTPKYQFNYSQISNFGFRFVLLDENNQALHSPFMCKDYLQDIFWIENVKCSEEVYGMIWKPGMLDIFAEKFKIAILGGEIVLEDSIENFKAFINAFEEALEIPYTGAYPTDNPSNIVLEFSNLWTINSPMLSAYTTLVRLGQKYGGGNPLEYLKYLSSLTTVSNERKSVEGFPKYMHKEINRLTTNLPRLAALLQGKRPETKWEDLKNVMYAHNTGIMGYQDFPRMEV